MAVTTIRPPNRHSGDPATLADELERVRLAHRERRIQQVLLASRPRHREWSVTGPVPPALGQAIAGFADELARLRAALSLSSCDREFGDTNLVDSGKART